MTKKIFFISLVLLLTVATSSAQDRIQNIRQKYQEIVSGKGYTTSTIESEVCDLSFRVSKKDGEIRFVEVNGGAEGFSYLEQYFFWDGELFFIYTKTCFQSDNFEDDNLIYCYEYRHYFDVFWLKSYYKGYKYKAGENPPKVQNVDFYDDAIAYKQKESGDFFLELAKSNSLASYCDHD